MSSYKTFAIWGAGNLGTQLANGLLDRKASVIVLSRPASKDSQGNKDLAAKGAEIRAYDVQGPAAVPGLKGIDVLISTVGFPGLELQKALATAAQKAGVKLFVPTEFGDTTDGRPDHTFDTKVAIRKHLEEIRLPSAVYFTGVWTDFIPMLGLDFKSGKVFINGSGDAELSTTSIGDVADFVTYTLVTLPKEKLENTKFTIQGDKITFNSLTKALEQLSGKKFEVNHITRGALEEKLAGGDPFAGLFLGWDAGLGLHPNPLSHDVYPEFKPKTAVEVLGPLVK